MEMKDMIWKVALAALLATGVASANDFDELSIETLEQEYAALGSAVVEADQTMAKNRRVQIAQSAKSVPAGCLTAASYPLPTEPVGPKVTSRWRKSNGDAVDVTVWRKPCSNADSVALVTFKPVSTNGPFICGTTSTFTIIQDAVQSTSTSITDDERGHAAICLNLYMPITGVLNARMQPTFDHNKAFTVRAREFAAPLEVPAFDPTQYDLTPPVLRITHEFSGSWYYIGQDVQNQGWFLEFNPANKIALAAWFTGDETADQLMWYTANGSFTGNEATMDLYQTKYVMFGGSTGITTKTGSLKFTFTNCTTGVAEWEFDDGRAGSLPIHRMIAAPEGCDQ